jgi:hypothetical protein
MSTRTEACRGRRRRVQLAPMPSVPVEFTGQRAGEGPLTLGQLNIYTWLVEAPDHFYATLCAELPVPAAVSVADVARAVAALIGRHESLRTSYLPGEPPRQRVAVSGVRLLEVRSLGEGPWGPQDRPAVAEALTGWLRESPDPVRCPVRIAVAVAPGAGERVIACAAAFSHVAVDQGAIKILRREFAGLLGDSPPEPADRPGHQPLDQAELEATAAEQRRADAALAYLREQTRRTPRHLYGVPGGRASGESLAVELSSPAAAMAVRQAAARTRTSRSSLVLAALCAVVARRAGYRELVVTLSSGNRFERHLADYVGTLAGSALAAVEITAGSFDELVRHTWMRVLEANRHARYDNVRRDAMERLIERERGLMRLNYEPFFNDLVPASWSALTAGVGFEPAQIDAALARTELRWRPTQIYGTPIRFTLNQIDGCLRLDAWSADTGLVPQAEVVSVLLAVERLLVAAARGDVAGARLPEIIGLEPFAASPDRILVDHCWVDVADIQRMLEEALAPAVARVFASVDGQPLVAHVAATDAVRTPEQAHARCMTALATHLTAITPRRYVMCPAAPPDPADPAAWPPPLAAGSGR